MTFLGDLKFGQVTEKVIMDKLKENFDEVRAHQDGECDISFPVKIEVKRERGVKKYGNIAIELEYKGKMSGPFSSLADIWIWEIDGSYFWTYRQELLRWLSTNEDKYEVKMGGDGNNSKLALIPVFKFVTDVTSKLIIENEKN